MDHSKKNDYSTNDNYIPISDSDDEDTDKIRVIGWNAPPPLPCPIPPPQIPPPSNQVLKIIFIHTLFH